MPIPIKILEVDGLEVYLKKRGIYKQYIKAKKNILSGSFTGSKFKKRKPKSGDLWYFRINKKYRAIGKFRGEIFVVGVIDDHQ